MGLYRQNIVNPFAKHVRIHHTARGYFRLDPAKHSHDGVLDKPLHHVRQTGVAVDSNRFDPHLLEARPRKHLTLVHKHNVLTFAGHLWRRTVEDVARDFPEVQTAYQHVDAATIFLATDPGRFDVIVTDNLFGDIITDIAAAIAGGIGLAASGNINPARTTPSMFEPVHGSAPDIYGQNIANPIAMIWSGALMLDFLTHGQGAGRAAHDTIVAAMEEVIKNGPRTPDLGGTANTTQVGEAIAAMVAQRKK